jgi:hypothetical protein
LGFEGSKGEEMASKKRKRAPFESEADEARIVEADDEQDS